MVASLIGLPIAYLLTVSLEAGDGWDSPMAIAILGAGTLVSAELLTAWFDQVTLRAWLRPVLLAGVVAPLVPTLEIGWAGLVIALATWVSGNGPGAAPTQSNLSRWRWSGQAWVRP